MKKECTLIATIPSLSNIRNISKIFNEKNITEARYNTGVRSPYSPYDSLKKLQEIANYHGKKLWVDIKGRQLRINSWADPLYECVELNHEIKVDLPAKIFFRNGTSCDITHIDGNKLFLSEPPREALGKGQSINILGENLKIQGEYLTELDKEYLKACKELHISNIMASYVEDESDIDEISRIIDLKPECFCAKIESERGLTFILNHSFSFSAMAARDDMYIELEENYKKMIEALKLIAVYDTNAICASRIFLSLERKNVPDFSDFEDLEMMYALGYRRFMLCDNICNYAFEKAISAWEVFTGA